jgi:alpha-L-fucosidase
MPTGEIEPRQAERLREMGRWLEKYGESIYGTRGGPLKPGRGGVSTHKGDTIYLHVLQWQGDTIALPALPRKVVSATLLTGGQVKVLQQEDAISLTVAKADQQEIDTIVALKLDGPASDIAPLGMTPARGVIRPGMKATASNVFQRMAEYAPGHAVDGDSNTRWATDAGTHQAWLEVDLGRPTEVSGVSVDEACGRRVQQFEVQAQETGRWKTIFQGGEIGEGYSASFAPATVQIVRLNIVRASEGPTINEFQLHAPKKK